MGGTSVNSSFQQCVSLIVDPNECPFTNFIWQTMAISSVLVVDLYTGFTATVWTWWLAFAVAFGLVVQWAFTVCANPLPFDCVSQMTCTDHLLSVGT